MRWPVIRTIWFREVRDQLRDRRTVIMLLIFPLLLYPGLGLGLAQLAVLFTEQPVTVGVAGAELLEMPEPPSAEQLASTTATVGAWTCQPFHLPGLALAAAVPLSTRNENPFHLQQLPPLLEGNETQGYRFAANLFPDRADQNLLHVVRAEPAPLAQLLEDGKIQAAVLITPQTVHDLRNGKRGFLDVRLRDEKRTDQRLEGIGPSTPTGEGRPLVVLTTGDDLSKLAYGRLHGVLSQWDQEIVKSRMAAAVEAAGANPGAKMAYHRPVRIPVLQESKSGRVWSQLFPFLIIMMSLTGALYPAIDVCAGEKERGTMETLLISPASRSEIVWGKFLTVWLFSTATSLLNLASLGFTAWQFSSAASAASGTMGGEQGPLPAPTLAAIGWCVVLLVPLAAFFSAACLALAAYARSSKEGQYYLMPLLLVTLPLTLVTLAPGAELTPLYSMIPITGAALLLQALINARTAEQLPWPYLVPVLLPLAAYCYLALHWAIQQFNREEVLFREAERLDLRLWLRSLFREKQPLPTAAQAVTAFLVILLLRWLLSTTAGYGDFLLQAAVMQVIAVALPASFLALLLTSRPLLTLRLQWPQFSLAVDPDATKGDNRMSLPGLLIWAAWGLLLALALHGPLLALLSLILRQLPPQVAEQLKEFGRAINLQGSLGLQLLMLAVLPAICEELAFRGFILSGFLQRLGAGKAVVASSFLFAFAHLNAFQFLPTLVLGLVLGLLVIRSGSLLPAVIFHMVHNGLALATRFYVLEHEKANLSLPPFFSESGLYGWPAVAGGAVLAAILIAMLVFLPRARLKAE